MNAGIYKISCHSIGGILTCCDNGRDYIEDVMGANPELIIDERGSEYFTLRKRLNGESRHHFGKNHDKEDMPHRLIFDDVVHDFKDRFGARICKPHTFLGKHGICFKMIGGWVKPIKRTRLINTPIMTNGNANLPLLDIASTAAVVTPTHTEEDVEKAFKNQKSYRIMMNIFEENGFTFSQIERLAKNFEPLRDGYIYHGNSKIYVTDRTQLEALEMFRP